MNDPAQAQTQAQIPPDDQVNDPAQIPPDDQVNDTLNPSNPTRSLKERTESSSLDTAPIDAGSGVLAVEHEKVPEIPVEVESFLHKVEEHQDEAPDEIVIADGTVETVKASYPSTPVVVLPITQKEEKEGKKKSPKFSFRWLVEWSHKIIKIFTGKVIYKVSSSGKDRAPEHKEKSNV